jgi:uncharacterized protein (TIRG00374 family)
MRKVWIRRAIALAALGVVVYLFWPLLKDIRAAAHLFRTARWEWLAVALLIQVCSYSCLTWLNILALKPFSGRIGFGRLTFVLTAMAFITAAVPSAGASGAVLRARLLGRFGYTVEASTFSLLLELIYVVVGTVLVGLFGLGYLLQVGRLAALEIVLLAAVVLLAALLVWAGWRLVSNPLRSLRLVKRLAGTWNRLAGRLRLKALDPQEAESRLLAFNQGLKELRMVPRWMFFLATAGRLLLDVGTLGACFALLGHLIRPDILLISYGLIMVISSLAILPGGLGLADVSLPVLFNRLGVPGSLALAAGLTYRLLAFWLVRLIGFVSWQLLEGSAERKLKREENP